MPTAFPSLLVRNDTILGVCQGLGDDFRIHANWLRVAFAVAFYFNPVAVIAVYLGLGVLVAVVRWLAPNELVAVAAAPAAPPALLEAGYGVEAEELRIAA